MFTLHLSQYSHLQIQHLPSNNTTSKPKVKPVSWLNHQITSSRLVSSYYPQHVPKHTHPHGTSPQMPPSIASFSSVTSPCLLLLFCGFVCLFIAKAKTEAEAWTKPCFLGTRASVQSTWRFWNSSVRVVSSFFQCGCWGGGIYIMPWVVIQYWAVYFITWSLDTARQLQLSVSTSRFARLVSLSLSRCQPFFEVFA